MNDNFEPNQDGLQANDDGKPSGNVEKRLTQMNTEREDSLLRATLAHVPGVNLERLDDLCVAVKASGVRLNQEGRFPSLPVALQVLKHTQENLFQGPALNVGATSTSDLKTLFGPGSRADLANALAIKDKILYRRLRSQAVAEGII